MYIYIPGSQFTSAVWSAFTNRLGIKNQLTTPYHPQANGAVERFHRQLQDALLARLAGPDWPSHLPWVLLGLRAAPRDDSGVYAAELVCGCQISLPGQFLSAAEPPPASFVRQLTSPLPCVADISHIPCECPASARRLQEAAYVYVKAALVSPSLLPVYRGPYCVLVLGQRYFILEVSGKPQALSADNLKPHLGSSLVHPTAALPRGCPKRLPAP
jgi:hypothetical protein